MARHLLLSLLLLAACSVDDKRQFGTISPLEAQSTSAGSAASTAPRVGTKPSGTATASGASSEQSQASAAATDPELGTGPTSEVGENPAPDGNDSSELDASVSPHDTSSNPGNPSTDAEPNTEPSAEPSTGPSSEPSTIPSTDPSVGPSLASNGATCGSAAACSSNHCVDGVCCDSACDGVCASCNQAGKAGSCQATPSDTSCGALSCPANTECLTYQGDNLANNCSALNQCKQAATCNPTKVTSGTACQSGAGKCDGQGECVVPNKKALGETCAAPAECGSNFCAKRTDGVTVCSNAACDAKCQASTNDGYCTAVPLDDTKCGTIDCPSSTSCTTYPADVTANRCASFGNCVTVAAVCPATQKANGFDCGGGQTCNGSGVCRLVCPTNSGAGRTCSAQCPCTAGQGVCTADNQCASGMVCGTDAALKFGFTGKTCIAAHCNNDVKDGTETSVDCGGECGCSATFEQKLTFTGMPSDPSIFGPEFTGLSGDGSRLVGLFQRSSTPYTIVASRTNVVTELADPNSDPSQPGSYPIAISKDGNTILGAAWGSGGIYKWVGTAAPAYVTSDGARGMSSTGSVVVGTTGGTGFRLSSGGLSTTISTLAQVTGVSDDGINVYGSLTANTNTVGVWSSQTGVTTTITHSGWSNFTAQDISGTAPFAVGYAAGSGGEFGFRWKGGATPLLTDIPAVSGMTTTRPESVTPDGTTIVGSTSAATTDPAAFIWTEAGGSRLLLTELRNRGLELADAEAWYAHWVSDDGAVIVGTVSGSPNRYWRAVLSK